MIPLGQSPTLIRRHQLFKGPLGGFPEMSADPVAECFKTGRSSSPSVNERECERPFWKWSLVETPLLEWSLRSQGVCSRNPFPLFLLGIPSIHSLPEAGFWEPQYVPPGLHYGCIMPIPSLQLQKNTSLMQRSRGFCHGFVVSKICYNTVIVLSVVLWDCCKPTNTCRDRAFSNSGLEAGLPAFQLPMFTKCEALQKRDMLDMFV